MSFIAEIVHVRIITAIKTESTSAMMNGEIVAIKHANWSTH